MKIGILLYPMVLNKYTIGEAIQHYCLKYALDDIIFVAFKGTDAHMRCRIFPYHFGRNEDNIKDRPLELCSRGLHSCWELDAVFDYYPLRYLQLNANVGIETFGSGRWLIREFGWEGVNNRYFIALPEAPICYGKIKMCSNVLNILKEIPHSMAVIYHEELRAGRRFSNAIANSGLYSLINDAVNEFIAKNKDGNDYVNIISYNEGGD